MRNSRTPIQTKEMQMQTIAEVAGAQRRRNEGPEQLVEFLDMSQGDIKRYSIFRGIQAMRASIMSRACGIGSQIDRLAPFIGPARFEGLEADCHRELAKRLGEPAHQGRFYVPSEICYRDLTAALASGGGYLVGTTTGGVTSFIERLRNLTCVFRLGAQRMPGQRESLAIPKQSNSATIIWQSTEQTQATESTLSFGQAAGVPKTAIAYIEISNLLLKQSNPAAEAIVMLSLAADLSVGIDAAALTGSGASGQPTGLSNTAGIGSVTG